MFFPIRSFEEKWPAMPREALLKKLELPPVGRRIDMVLDTDTWNEVDDQFALAYALLSPERLNVQAIYAAPFFNDRSASAGDGMEKSYQEIRRLLSMMNVSPEGLAFRGSERTLSGHAPVDSPAARDLVRRAMARKADDPLYVVAIGAITNIASAILMEPEIIRRIVVVWLGGQPLHWPTAGEFNLSGDLIASRLIFDCGVPLIQVPCMGVASHLLASVPELQAFIGGKNPLCDALVELFSAYADDTFGWAKEIWDVSAIGILMNPEWSLSAVESSPILSLDTQTCARHTGRHPFRIVSALDRNAIFRDMYRKLANA